MATLNTTPGSSTPAQRQMLVLAGKALGLSVDDLRDQAGGSLRAISSADASAMIKRLTGQELPHPPGQKPRDKRKRRPGFIRMITNDQIEQIERLMLEYFGNLGAGHRWLLKDFHTRSPRELGNVDAAGNVIRVLKEMVFRKDSKQCSIT